LTGKRKQETLSSSNAEGIQPYLENNMINARQGRELATCLRERGIRDTRVLKAIEAVPRKMFVSSSFAEESFLDKALPIACGQTISQPFVVAYMTEKLAPQPDHDVLEIGTGSGYQTAVLAQICHHVFTIERHEQLHLEAQQRLGQLQFTNVTFALGDGTSGWPEDRQFDRIIVTAAAPETPVRLLQQLTKGGRLIAPIGKKPERQRLVQFDKRPQGISAQDLLPVRFVPLVG
jgi:protein-L-isoaspartate(D-aspartate) O-methyltransferase